MDVLTTEDTPPLVNADGPFSDALRAAFGAGYSRRRADLTGTTIHSYGDSFLTDLNVPYERGVAEWVGNRIGAADVVHRGIGGASMGRVLVAMVNSGYSWAPGTRGLVLLKAVVNSMFNSTAAQDAQEKVGFAEALRAALCIVRAATWANEDDTATQSMSAGEWTNGSPPGMRGGLVTLTEVPGATVTVTTTGGRAVDLVLVAFPDNASGADFTVTVNGAYHSSGTTRAKSSPSVAAGYHQIVHRVTGLAGPSTIVLTHNDTVERALYYDGHLTAAAEPPGVVVCLDVPPTQTGMNVAGADAHRTPANVDVENSIVTQVCAEFDELVRVADPRPGFDNALDRAGDQLHPNATGAAKYGAAMHVEALQLPASAGLLT